MNDCAKSIARIALDIGAIKLSPQDPFTWASGYRNPIYNDNRLLLCDFEYRSLVTGGFEELVRREHIPFEVIAGTATAGVPWATSLADRLKMPLVYVREKPKTHGAGKQVEGVLKPGQKVLLVEDLISTGKSSGAAAEAIRREGGVVNAIVSIFTYELQEAAGCFTGLNVNSFSLLRFSELLDAARSLNAITAAEHTMLSSWSAEPLSWGEKHGFPKVDKC